MLRTRFGEDCRSLQALGYAQALGLLRVEMSRDEAVAAAQQGHRNYAKRQLTWFRRDAGMQWLQGFGDQAAIQDSALQRTATHIAAAFTGVA